MQHSSKRQGAVPATACSSVIADFQDFWSYTGLMQAVHYVNVGGEWREKRKRAEDLIYSSTVSLWGTTIRTDEILWNVCLIFCAFLFAGMRITSVWMRWCRCSVKWFWSSHYSSWMQTWTPRTISQHYFLWVLLHLTLLGACLLVCRSLPEVLPGC